MREERDSAALVNNHGTILAKHATTLGQALRGEGRNVTTSENVDHQVISLLAHLIAAKDMCWSFGVLGLADTCRILLLTTH